MRCNLHSLVTTSDQCESLEEKKVTNEIMAQLYKIKKEIMGQLDRHIKFKLLNYDVLNTLVQYNLKRNNDTKRNHGCNLFKSTHVEYLFCHF